MSYFALFQSWGPFFTKYVPHSMQIFEKKPHPISAVEGLKLSLDFLCNSYSWYGHINGSVCILEDPT